ncbi:hypothetical protein ARTHRO9AX_30029 [Arthrobacter sp. 9AX]|nr:hypothetical protein ARTHRO9AX_30029 [Arthrobacter sp. 9AX]
MFHGHPGELSRTCASAYIAQSARVPHRFGSGQMFQLSDKSFFWRLGAPPESPESPSSCG